MSRKKTFFDGQPKLFTPSKIRGLSEGSSPILNYTVGVNTGSVPVSSASFRYDPPGSPIKSTQQIPIDWSKFENHTFFNSAEAKVNTSFDVIINGYPFDGSRKESHDFFDNMTGYEKYVYDRFPKSRGYLNFSGSVSHSDTGGSYIKVTDAAGIYSPELSRNSSGKAVLDNQTKPITFDFHIHLPSSLTQQNQVLFQRLSGSNGFTVAIDATTASESSGSITMLVSSGSEGSSEKGVLFMSASMELSKGDFQHVCLTYDPSPGVNRLKLYRNFKLQTTSSKVEMGAFGYSNAAMFIGSGSNHPYGEFDGSTGLSFSQTFSGSIDELRVYHETRSGKEQKKYSKQNVYPSEKLKLYYKFNEPTGSYTSNDVVIDSSGASLHSTITNFNTDLRGQINSLESPLTQELSEENPVLFPSYPDVITLNQLLLTSASSYDANNPNMITKLVPQHYFLEASIFEGFGQDKELGHNSDEYGSVKNFPGGGKLESAQIIASFLFVWAKFFDEMKIHLDHFGKLMHVDPVAEDSIGDLFLPFLAGQYGMEIPALFPEVSLDQFTTRRGHKVDTVLSKNSLQYVQNQIWRRILSDLNEIMRSKGTIHSIKALMRNMGINPDQNFRFREYGGSPTGKLSDRRERRVKIIRGLDFSGSFGSAAFTTGTQGEYSNRPYFTSAPLKAKGTRTEPGLPKASSTAAYNNLLTSGSWTYEGLYQMTPHATLKFYHPQTSSLVRFSTSGSTDVSLKDRVYLNLLAFSGSNDLATTGSLSLIFRDTNHKTDAKKLVLPLTGVNIYDGDNWYISFGRIRNNLSSSIASSSWFLRAGKQVAGSISQYYETYKLFDDSYSNSALSTTTNNVSGSKILIGTQSIPCSTDQYGLSYKDSTLVNDLEKSSFFGGKIMNMRFWSKGISPKEAREHIRNPSSLGVEKPKKNFNFVTKISGSWERLRVDYDLMQEKTGSDASGQITFVDMTQNGLFGTGSGFQASKRVIKPEVTTVSTLSTHFDQASDYNKIRVRSFTDKKNIKNSNSQAVQAPAYKIPEDEEPLDDTRFSIEISSVQALNEDIINIFASLDAFDNFIGAPELQFSDDYPDLEHLRDVYFNRLTKKVNIKEFFEFFKWFNMSFSQMIDLLVPRRTKFLGVNFVIEPHMLERPKMRYNTQDMYVGPNDRHGNKGTILLRQLVGDIKRY